MKNYLFNRLKWKRLQNLSLQSECFQEANPSIMWIRTTMGEIGLSHLDFLLCSIISDYKIITNVNTAQLQAQACDGSFYVSTGHTDLVKCGLVWVRLGGRLEEINIWEGWCVKQAALQMCAGLLLSTVDLNREAWVRGTPPADCRSRTLAFPGNWLFLATGRGLKRQLFLGRPPAGLGLELHAGHWVSNLQTSNLGTSWTH